MRMLFLAVLVFLLAGVSLTLSRFDVFATVSQRLTSDHVELSFEPVAEVEERNRVVGIQRTRPDDVMLLSRATVTQTAHFQMLQDAAVTSGTLNLRATSQLGEGQSSVLRIFVGNQVRGEVLLRPGRQVINTDVGLTSDDLAGDALAIRFTMTTPNSIGSCTQNQTWGNIVEIEHDTRILLNIRDSELTPRDQVAAWGNEVLIGWPSWLPADQRQERSALGLQLGMLGYAVRYVDAPNSATMVASDMRTLIAQGPVAPTQEAGRPEWPETVTGAGPNAGLRTFHGSTTWRHWYRIGPDDHTTTPTAFEYEILLGSLPSDAGWTLSFTHNGSVLELREVDGRATTIRGSIPLTYVAFEPSNVIEVTATSNHETIGLCNDGPELLAELRPTSQLVGGGDYVENGLNGLDMALSTHQAVSIDVSPELSLIEMQRFHNLVTRLLPVRQDLSFEGSRLLISSLRGADYETVIPNLTAASFVAWADEDSRLRAVQVRTLQASDPDDWPMGALALVVGLGRSVASVEVDLR